MAANIPANSIAITPPPITASLFGISLKFNISSLVSIPSKLAPSIGGTVVFEPVAIIIFFAVSSFVLPSESVRATVFLSFKEAVPLITSILLASKSFSMPETN